MIVVDSPPGITRPSSPSSSSGSRTSTTSAPSRRSTCACSRNAPCRASTPIRTSRSLDSASGVSLTRDALPAANFEPLRRRGACSRRCRPSAGRGPPRRRRAPSGRRSASSPRRSPRARARRPGSRPDLKMPEPTKTPSAPSCMQSDASAGVAMPPAVNVTTGSRPFSATHWTSSNGARCSFAAACNSSVRSAWSSGSRRRRRACASRH